MIINYLTISLIFSDFLKDPSRGVVYQDEFQKLVFQIIKTNKILWDLEDSARLSELGDAHVAQTKRNIDINNQYRNNLIKQIDNVLHEFLKVASSSPDKFYSESPGMIIDRLSIIFIKLSVVQKVISAMKEDDLRHEYLGNEKILSGQIRALGNFFDEYVDKLSKGVVFFEIQQPVKIYNDSRIKKYLA